MPDAASAAPMTRKDMLHPARVRFLKFLAVGGFAAAVNFGSRIVFSLWLGYVVAIVLAYLLGMITAFVLNRLLVFRHSSNALLVQVWWFCVVNGVALLQTLGISLALVHWLLPWMGLHWHPELVAHAVGVAVPVITSYVGHKHLSFRQHQPE